MLMYVCAHVCMLTFPRMYACMCTYFYVCIEGRLRKIVKIDSMQFGFMSGRSTTDAIFIVRQLQEKYLAKSKDLWMAFVDMEKAFDRVPREVVWWALRYLGVD